MLTTFCNPPRFGTPEAKRWSCHSRYSATDVRIRVKLHCIRAEILRLACDNIPRLRAPSKQIIILTSSYMDAVTVVFTIALGKVPSAFQRKSRRILTGYYKSLKYEMTAS